MLSDCCCCLDAFERGHERTVQNNLRMILEDFCSIVEASENDSVFTALQQGKHQASRSISFATSKYPKLDIGNMYGELSKTSHHKEQGLFTRQWTNPRGIISHIKPFNPNLGNTQGDILFRIMLFARIVGEVAEKLCIDELEAPYFWTKEKELRPSPPINITVFEVGEILEEKREQYHNLVGC